MEFEERNLSDNPSYASELQELGARGTPATVIGEQVIIGFDQKQLSEALNL